MKGYAISGGSACSSGSVKSSATLKEIDMDEKLAERTVRVSFGKNLQEENIIGLSDCITDIVNSQNQKSDSSA
jgi:cysteine desulfurase